MTKECENLLLKIADDRVKYFDKIHDRTSWYCWKSAFDCIEYAINNNIGCLEEFDCYGEFLDLP